MPRVNRTEICATDEIQAFHLMNRCVRRTYLCGEDVNTGKDYSHRKEWIRSRLEELAGIFALDVMSFAVLSNHLHVVVRTRPDIVKSWSDDDVALHWWRLFPSRRDANGAAAEPLESELNSIRNNASGLKEKRRRLCDISWFMRCLAEPIARCLATISLPGQRQQEFLPGGCLFGGARKGDAVCRDKTGLE